MIRLFGMLLETNLDKSFEVLFASTERESGFDGLGCSVRVHFMTERSNAFEGSYEE